MHEISVIALAWQGCGEVAVHLNGPQTRFSASIPAPQHPLNKPLRRRRSASTQHVCFAEDVISINLVRSGLVSFGCVLELGFVTSGTEQRSDTVRERGTPLMFGSVSFDQVMEWAGMVRRRMYIFPMFPWTNDF